MNAHDPPAALVRGAAGGDQSAWDALVDRYSRMIVEICRQYRLSDADTHDVSQTVWLRLVEHLAQLREPNALPGWLATTTRRTCLLILRRHSRPLMVELPPEGALVAADDDLDEALLRAERRAALRVALSEIPPRCQELLRLLTAVTPVRYEEISHRLGMKVGSIGPTRARCLEKLRASPALVAYVASERGATVNLDDGTESRSPR